MKTSFLPRTPLSEQQSRCGLGALIMTCMKYFLKHHSIGSMQLNYWHSFMVCDLYLYLNMPEINSIIILLNKQNYNTNLQHYMITNVS